MSAYVRVSDSADQSGFAVQKHYTATAQALHWVTAGLMFAVLPLAWVMVSMGPNDPSRGLLFLLHKSIGLTIIALAAARLFWRAFNHAPPLAYATRWEAGAAFTSHWLLYLVLIAMPVSGYILSSAGGHPVSYFGLFTLPMLPNDPALARTATWIHVAVGQWVVYALVLLHLAGTAWHVIVRRDGVLERMLPDQDGL